MAPRVKDHSIKYEGEVEAAREGEARAGSIPGRKGRSVFFGNKELI